MTSSLSETLVRDVMAKNLISVPSETTIFQIAKMMEQGGVGAIFVKKGDKPVGIITDRDYAVKVAVNKISLDTPVDKIASYPLITVSPEDSITDAAKIMSSKKIRKLAVEQDDKIVGIVTSTNIVSEVAEN